MAPLGSNSSVLHGLKETAMRSVVVLVVEAYPILNKRRSDLFVATFDGLV